MNAKFPVQDTSSAPLGSRPHLEHARRLFGTVPNLIGVMAASPALTKGYLAVAGAFAESSFSPLEQHVVLQTVNSTNRCHYCTVAHSAAALNVLKIEPSVDRALRERTPLADARLETLRQTTVRIVENRGWLADADVDAFLAAGYTPSQLLEVVLGVGMKTLSNYVNHIAHTPLDASLAATTSSSVPRRERVG